MMMYGSDASRDPAQCTGLQSSLPGINLPPPVLNIPVPACNNVSGTCSMGGRGSIVGAEKLQEGRIFGVNEMETTIVPITPIL